MKAIVETFDVPELPGTDDVVVTNPVELNPLVERHDRRSDRIAAYGEAGLLIRAVEGRRVDAAARSEMMWLLSELFGDRFVNGVVRERLAAFDVAGASIAHAVAWASPSTPSQQRELIAVVDRTASWKETTGHVRRAIVRSLSARSKPRKAVGPRKAPERDITEPDVYVARNRSHTLRGATLRNLRVEIRSAG